MLCHSSQSSRIRIPQILEIDVHCAVKFDWAESGLNGEEISAFFIANTDPNYISHSEIQGGRATNIGQWSENLRERLKADIDLVLKDRQTSRNLPKRRLAVGRARFDLVACALVSFQDDRAVPYAVFEDIIVRRADQGTGTGAALIAWLESECRARDIKRVFLESGTENERAHTFFKHRGFRQTSIVMMKELPPDDG
jgi:GNAT superfamily N-acetyltransferase